MNNAQMSARVGLFFLLGVALIWVTFEALTSGKVRRDRGYRVIAHFSNLKELKAGDEVRMAGVKVGTIAETRLAGRRAEAVFLIDSRVQIAHDAVATIGMAGLLGANYVSLDLGTEGSGYLKPDAQIRTADTPDLNTIVSQIGEIGRKIDDALSQFTGAIGGSNGNGLLGKIDRLVDENSARVGQITTDLRDITAKVNKGEGTLGRLVNDPAAYESLVSTLGEIKVAATEAKAFVSSTQSIIDQVRSGKGTLGSLLYDDEAGQNIKVVAKNLRELSDKLNKGEGTLGKLISDDTLFRDAQGIMRKVDRAVDGLADQGPITAVGVAANALF
ncbi:MAG: MCE family protein [Opitutaceae bacterium]|jgi:phospholipid/cholesterol/gamma-HCH transport system substrate-binding protein|nr:MCE family protein [Opitutaceae bacterium]